MFRYSSGMLHPNITNSILTTFGRLYSPNIYRKNNYVNINLNFKYQKMEISCYC